MNPSFPQPLPTSRLDLPPSPAASESSRVTRAWAGGRRMLFVYLALFVVGRMHESLPLGSPWLSSWLRRPWEKIVPWFGRNVLQLPEPVSTALSSSRDRLFDWVQVTLFLTLALVAALAWRWLDRARRWDRPVREVVQVAVRYTLAAAMLSYGMSKLLLEQMAAPTLQSLIEPVGQLSPMRLLWIFMGYSPAYSIFAGAVEVIGGLLLLFRRTTTLGALILMPVLVNVLLINLCFGVPIKLNAAHYLLMVIVLAAPVMGRVIDVVVRNCATLPDAATPLRWDPRVQRTFGLVKWVIIAALIWFIPVRRYLQWRDVPAAVKSEFYGLYAVEGFVRNGESRPPLLTDTGRWRYVTIDAGDVVSLIAMDDQRSVFQLRAGPESGRLTLQSLQRENAPREEFVYRRPAPGQLALEGKLDGVTLSVLLVPADERNLRLITERFRWVAERPAPR